MSEILPTDEAESSTDAIYQVDDGNKRLIAASNTGQDTILAWVRRVVDHPTETDGEGNPMMVYETYEIAQTKAHEKAVIGLAEEQAAVERQETTPKNLKTQEGLAAPVSRTAGIDREQLRHILNNSGTIGENELPINAMAKYFAEANESGLDAGFSQNMKDRMFIASILTELSEKAYLEALKDINRSPQSRIQFRLLMAKIDNMDIDASGDLGWQFTGRVPGAKISTTDADFEAAEEIAADDADRAYIGRRVIGAKNLEAYEEWFKETKKKGKIQSISRAMRPKWEAARRAEMNAKRFADLFGKGPVKDHLKGEKGIDPEKVLSLVMRGQEKAAREAARVTTKEVSAEKLRELRSKQKKWRERIGELNERHSRAIKELREKYKGKEQEFRTRKKALEAVLKSQTAEARRAERTAYLEGLKEGKQYIRELTKKQKERQELREYVKRLARVIGRPPSSNVHAHYAGLIRQMQDTIDPAFRADKTLEKRAKLKKLLEERPELKNHIPKKLQETALKKSLQEFTLLELEDMAAQIELWRKLGKLRRNMEVSRMLRREADERAAMIERIRQHKRKGLDKGQPAEKRETGLTGDLGRDRGRRFRTGTLGYTARDLSLGFSRPPRWFDWIDGGRARYDGPVHEIFFNSSQEALSEEYRNVDRRNERIRKILGFEAKIAGTKKFKGETLHQQLVRESIEQARLSDQYRNFIKKLQKPEKYTDQNGEAREITREEILGIWALLEQGEVGRATLEEGNGFTVPVAKDLISRLTEKELALGNAVLEDYEAEYDRLDKAHIKRTGQSLVKVDGRYSPLVRILEGNTFSRQLGEEMETRRPFARFRGMEKGFTETRKPGATQKVRLQLIATHTKTIEAQEHYINSAMAVEKMQRHLRDPQFRLEIEERFSPNVLKEMENWVSDFADPRTTAPDNFIDKMVKKMRRNVAVAYLSYNLVTMLKQLPSMALYLAEAGIEEWASALAQMPFRGMEMIRFVQAKDPYMKHRTVEREIGEILASNDPAVKDWVAKVGNKGMRLLVAFDRMATTVGWMAVYNSAKAEGFSEQESINKARNATIRTQPANHPTQLPRYYKSSELFNVMNMFTNQLNNIFGIWTYDIPRRFGDKQYYKASLGILSMTLSSMGIFFATNKRPPDDEKEWLEFLLGAYVASVPVIGKSAWGWTKGYVTEGFVPGIVDFVQGGVIIAGKVYAQKDITWKHLLRMGQALAVTIGLPYAPINRATRTLDALNTGEIYGVLPVLQSLTVGPPTERPSEKKIEIGTRGGS